MEPWKLLCDPARRWSVLARWVLWKMMKLNKQQLDMQRARLPGLRLHRIMDPQRQFQHRRLTRRLRTVLLLAIRGIRLCSTRHTTLHPTVSRTHRNIRRHRCRRTCKARTLRHRLTCLGRAEFPSAGREAFLLHRRDRCPLVGRAEFRRHLQEDRQHTLPR